MLLPKLHCRRCAAECWLDALAAYGAATAAACERLAGSRACTSAEQASPDVDVQLLSQWAIWSKLHAQLGGALLASPAPDPAVVLRIAEFSAISVRQCLQALAAVRQWPEGGRRAGQHTSCPQLAEAMCLTILHNCLSHAMVPAPVFAAAAGPGTRALVRRAVAAVLEGVALSEQCLRFLAADPRACERASRTYGGDLSVATLCFWAASLPADCLQLQLPGARTGAPILLVSLLEPGSVLMALLSLLCTLVSWAAACWACCAPCLEAHQLLPGGAARCFQAGYWEQRHIALFGGTYCMPAGARSGTAQLVAAP
jgi:hypothetical protein